MMNVERTKVAKSAMPNMKNQQLYKKKKKLLPTLLENGMLRHSLGREVNFFSFAALNCSRLGFNALLASPR